MRISNKVIIFRYDVTGSPKVPIMPRGANDRAHLDQEIGLCYPTYIKSHHFMYSVKLTREYRPLLSLDIAGQIDYGS